MSIQPSNSINNSNNVHSSNPTDSSVTNDVWLNFAPHWHIQCGRTDSDITSRFRNRKYGNTRLDAHRFLKSIIEKQHERIQEINEIAKKFMQGYQIINQQNTFTTELIENNANKLNGSTQTQKELISNQFNTAMQQLVIELLHLNTIKDNGKPNQMKQSNGFNDNFSENETNSNTQNQFTSMTRWVSPKHQFDANDGTIVTFAQIHDLNNNIKILMRQNEQLMKQNADLMKQNEKIVC